MQVGLTADEINEFVETAMNGRTVSEIVERAGRERVAPMLMTALTAGIALVPLVLAAGEPGKEILYPVATVILGGLISSTLLDFFVHPALVWCFGRAQAEKAMAAAGQELTWEHP